MPAIASSRSQQDERRSNSRGPPYYTRQLPANVRTALAIGDAVLACRLLGVVEPRDPLNECAISAVRGQLAEHAGDLEEAAALYAEAASRWQEFGNVAERAYAL